MYSSAVKLVPLVKASSLINDVSTHLKIFVELLHDTVILIPIIANDISGTQYVVGFLA